MVETQSVNHKARGPCAGQGRAGQEGRGDRTALTCAIMPVKAQRRNMRRGMLTRY